MRPAEKMIRRSVIGLLTAVLLAATKPAEAYFDTGNALLAICDSNTPFNVGRCVGTITGHYDMMMTQGYDCGNETTKNIQQLRDVVVKYLRENPADRSNQAGSLSFIAFMFAFDCKFPEPRPATKKQ